MVVKIQGTHHKVKKKQNKKKKTNSTFSKCVNENSNVRSIYG